MSFPHSTKKISFPVSDAGQKFAKFFTRGFFIQHKEKLGVVKTDAHVLRILVQTEDIGDQCGVIVPEPLLAVEESFSEWFDVADLSVQGLRDADDDARLARTLTQGCQPRTCHVHSIS